MAKIADAVSREIFEAVGRLCAYYAYLEGAVAQAIWLELKLEHGFGHPVTDRLQLRESFKLLTDIHKRARRSKVLAHLKTLSPRFDNLIEQRNLLVHGTITFHAGREDMEAGIRWMMRRGTYKSAPQAVTLEQVNALITECDLLTSDLSTIGRLY